jgi:small-conductance mechanosensitive channel
MEQGTRRLVRIILWEFAVLLVLILVIMYFDIYLEFGEIRKTLLEALPKTIVVILILVITKLVLSLLRPAFSKAFERTMASHAEVKMLWQLFSNLVWIFVIILLVLIVIGDFTGLLAFGVILAAMLWVMQKPLLNIAGWLDIIFHRPYAIGDRIEIDGKKGYVVDVGMFHTTIREFGGWMKGDTFTGRVISIPNSTIFEIPVINYTKDTPYIWDEIKVAITYESDHDIAKQFILDSTKEVVGEDMRKYSKLMIRKLEVKELQKELIEEPVVRMDFFESCVNFYAIYLCEVSKRREIRSEISKKILDKIKKDDRVRIAYPHMEIVGVGKHKETPPTQ